MKKERQVAGGATPQLEGAFQKGYFFTDDLFQLRTTCAWRRKRSSASRFSHQLQRRRRSDQTGQRHDLRTVGGDLDEGHHARIVSRKRSRRCVVWITTTCSMQRLPLVVINSRATAARWAGTRWTLHAGQERLGRSRPGWFGKCNSSRSSRLGTDLSSPGWPLPR